LACATFVIRGKENACGKQLLIKDGEGEFEKMGNRLKR
jgi:hypothetical protein